MLGLKSVRKERIIAIVEDKAQVVGVEGEGEEKGKERAEKKRRGGLRVGFRGD